MAKKIYNGGLYYRLSEEDEDVAQSPKGESGSISNQKILIKDFLLSKSDIKIKKEYTDDGVSGSSFSRPAFNEMMEDIEAGRINCVVVKDLSRFGREYIEAGNLLERVFPSLGVRFIAINDSVDTKYGMDSLTIALKNIMNDAYCRDISIKTRTNLAVKRNHGEFLGAFAPYGYEKDPENHNHLIVDDYASNVVQKIFTWKIQGMSCNRISQKLNDMHVLSPYDYKMKNGLLFESPFYEGRECNWSSLTVRRVLENEAYIGTLVQGMWTTVNHKVKKKYIKEKDQWTKVNDTHQAIIGKRDFQLVQKLLGLDTRTPQGSDICYPLSGMMTCADCGANMVRRPRSIKGVDYVYYDCQEFFSSKRKRCSGHSIREDKIEKLVLTTIQNQIALVLRMDECMKQLDLSMLTKLDQERLDKQISMHTADVLKYREMTRNLYEDLHDGIISREDYMDYKDEFELKKRAAEKGIADAEIEKKRIKNKSSKHYLFVEKFLQYENVQELTREMVVELVDAILIHDKKHIEITLAFQDEFQEAYQQLTTMVEQQELDKEVAICG